MPKSLRPGLTALLLYAGVTQAAAADWYSARHARPPQGSRGYLCHGYSCRIVTPVQLNEAEMREISAPFATKLRDAGAERKAISRSVQIFETIVGARIGTSNDLPGMQFGRAADGQMDCIDEATNTTTLLRMLAARGALVHHTVAEPTSRGFFLDLRYPHATAVVFDKAAGMKWAIDSWPDANGRPPHIQPLPDWYRSRRAGEAP